MDSLANSLADRFGSRLVIAPSARAQYAQSEGHHAHQPPSLVVQPETVEEVQLLVKRAAEERWSIVAYGAGTSLEGNAATTHADSLCVDFTRMNRILEVSAADLLCVVEPGVTREQLNEDLRATGLFFPVARIRHDHGALRQHAGQYPRTQGRDSRWQPGFDGNPCAKVRLGI